MFESPLDAYLIFLYDHPQSADVLLPAWQVACPFVEAQLQTATRVPKKVDEKHELSRRGQDSGARMRAARDSKSAIVITYIDICISNQ
jgi:hypothetical protein